MKSWLTLLGAVLFALPVSGQLTMAFDKTDPSCFNYTNGIAVVNASGGTEPYTYQWQNGLTWNQWWGIPAGTYSVTVTDAAGATASGSVTLTHPPLMSVSIDAVDVFCEGFNGSLTAKPVGGTPPYNFAWSNGQAEAVATGITSGDWMVTVLDSKLCHDVGTRYVDIPSQIFPNIVPEHPTCATCPNGTITVSTFGNHPPFNYSWENGSTSSSLTGLVPGSYPLSVTDQNGCQLTFETVLASPFGQIDLDFNHQDVLCFGKSDGVVEVIVTGGSGTHTYLWKNQDGTIVGTDNLLQNMAPGTYCVTVTDNTGTTATGCTTVSEPPELKVSINIVPTATGGTLTITATGGTLPYKMTLDGVMINSTTLDLLPKNYYYLCVIDANGCQVDVPFAILNPGCLQASVITSSTTCSSPNSGSATAVVSGGSGNYLYTWSPPAPSMPTITGLAGGTYSVTVTDLNNTACTGTASGVVVSHSNLVVSASGTDASCPGVADGSVTATVGNAQGAVTFNWNTTPPQSGQTITGLLPGTYVVTATDAVGCTDMSAVTIGTGSAPNAAFTVASVVCDGPTSTVSITNNSTNSTTYSWKITPPGTTSSDKDLAPFSVPNGQSVIVELTVGNGTACFDTETKVVDVPSGISVNVPASVKECADSVTINASGAAGLTYSWTGPGGFTSSLEDPVVTVDGTYYLTASNAGGCTATDSVKVELGDALAVSLEENPIDPCDAATTVIATATGATSYSWVLNNSIPVVNTTGVFSTPFLVPGTNTIVVTATNAGCTGKDTITVQSTPLTGLSLLGDSEICLGDELMVSVSPADTSATYQWDPPSTGGPTQVNTPTATGPMTFSVTVTGENGCTQVLTKTVMVKDPEALDPATFTKKICNDRFVTFTNNSGEPGTWNFGDPASGTANTGTGSPIDHIFSGLGTFNVTFTPTAECVLPLDLTVEVTTDDVITSDFDFTLGPDCSTSIDLSLKDKSTGATGYSWEVNTNPKFTSTVSNPTVTTIGTNGSYMATLIVTNADGCKDTLSKPITIDSLITPPTFASNPPICPEDCISLLSGNIPPGYVLVWSDSLSGANPIVCPDASNSYSLTVTYGPCVWTGETSVTVLPAAVVDGGLDVSVCLPDPITLTATGTGNFCWSTSPTFVPCLSTTSTVTIDPTQVSVIYVKSTVGSCEDVDTVNIKNNTLDVTADPAEDPVYACLGNFVTIGINAIPGKNLKFIWSNGMTVDMLTESPTASTTYSVTVTDMDTGCTDTESFNVEVIDLQPQVEVTAMKYEVCPNETVPITTTVTGNSGPYTFVWMGAGLDCNTCQNPVAAPTDSTTYTVLVTDSHGCTAMDDVRLRFINVTCAEPYIFLPNAFTPFDGNETNNILRVRGMNIVEMDFYIYDRWGEKMFESHDPNIGWNGKYKDKELTPDAYGYYLRVTCDDSTTFKKTGNVTLLR